MSVNLYIDYMSQPCRAIVAFCIAAKIPYKVIEIRLMNMAHKNEDYLKLNPFGKVPALEDNGFTLFESHAIMTYLANKYTKDDSLYPKDLQQRALIDAYLHWHHQNTRRTAMLFRALNPQIFPKEKDNVEAETKAVNRIFKNIENIFLKDSQYLCGQSNLTIADISAACEVIQLAMNNFDFKPFPKLKEWLDRCLSHPAMKVAHAVFFKVVAKSQAKAKL